MNNELAIGTTVQVLTLPDCNNEHLIGCIGKVIDISLEFSSGPRICPYITVMFDQQLGHLRFYPQELEVQI